MVNFVTEMGEQVRVPEWVQDLDAFRRWMDADDFPEIGHIWYLKGEVWVDMSQEQLFSHNDVKAEYTSVLRHLAKAHKKGRLLTDGVLLTNTDADLGCKPDVTYVTLEAIASGRVRLIEGMEEGFLELEGSPDMVLEIVSRGSVRKDRVMLRQAYWEADIREYWLVDARKEPLSFDILRHTATGYKAGASRMAGLSRLCLAKHFG